MTLLLLHFNSEQISFLKPYLIKAIAEMEIYPHHVARVFDYVYIKQGSRIAQLYGPYTMNGRTVEIDDLSTLNKRRTDLGLDSFEDYLRKRKISKN